MNSCDQNYTYMTAFRVQGSPLPCCCSVSLYSIKFASSELQKELRAVEDITSFQALMEGSVMLMVFESLLSLMFFFINKCVQ